MNFINLDLFQETNSHVNEIVLFINPGYGSVISMSDVIMWKRFLLASSKIFLFFVDTFICSFVG